MATSQARPSSVADDVTAVVSDLLRPQVLRIDRDGHYPRDVMSALGEAGAFTGLAAGKGGLVDKPDLSPTLDALALVAAECGATSFCSWCQGALTWYLRCSDNQKLRDELLAGMGAGQILGGTALSNPMKHSTGLEKLLLQGEPHPQEEGWIVSGLIPWVSNVEAGHPFAIVFSTPEGPPCIAVVDDTHDGLTLRPNDNFEVMAGTATVAAKFEKVHVKPQRILARDASEFLGKIRPGFVLIQAGMGLGLLAAAANVMDATHRKPSFGLPGGLLDTADKVRDTAASLHERALEQAAIVAQDDGPELAQTARLRLDLAEAVVQAATAAQLMAGASGLVKGRRAIRLVREAAFYGVLTPSVRHLSAILS